MQQNYYLIPPVRGKDQLIFGEPEEAADLIWKITEAMGYLIMDLKYLNGYLIKSALQGHWMLIIRSNWHPLPLLTFEYILFKWA